MAYQVTLTPTVEKVVAKLPKELRRRIFERLVQLETSPRGHGCIKLAGEEAYRVRVGDYRIIYTVEDTRLIVLVIEIGHRRDVYRGL